MSELNVSFMPELRRPVLVAAFRGWNDGGQGATLGAGFLGGEVTPLFFVGAALGNALGRALGIPLGLAAGAGMAATFAAASNTPLALSIMALELLGGAAFPHVVIVCVFSYVLTGHRSIYVSQRLRTDKAGVRLDSVLALRDLSAKTAPAPAATPPSGGQIG